MKTSASLQATAAGHRQAGRLDKAIGLLRQWVASSPRDPAAWNALADCLGAAQRPELALRAWDQALALAPAAAATLCGKAQSLRAMGRAPEAAEHYRRALASSPGDFQARFGLAGLAFDAGDLQAAGELAEALAQDYPDQPGVLWLSARIDAALDRRERALLRVERLLGLPALGQEARAEGLLLKSDILGRGGDAPAAFAAAAEGKTLQRSVFAGRAAGREGETARLGRLAAWFRVSNRSDWAATPADAIGDHAAGNDGPVFLVGFPRSGTTLLEQALAGHPNIVALEEAPTLAEPAATFLGSAEGLTRLAALTPDEAGAWRRRYWQAVAAHGMSPAGKLLLDKAPAGTAYLPIVAKLFPGAKVLFAVRDPRDVVLSCFLNNFQMNALTYELTSLAGTAACYSACMALAEIYRDLLPLNFREVRHELLVEGFESELRSIADFLGVEFDAAMTEVSLTANGRSVRTPSAVQVRAGLSRSGLARWRAYARELAPVSGTLAPWLERFRYAV